MKRVMCVYLPNWPLQRLRQERHELRGKAVIVVDSQAARGPRVVVAENPTRGLDLRATEEIHARLRAAAASGAAVLMYSSDLDEVLALAARVVVIARGVLTEVPGNATRVQVGELMVTGGR